MFKYSSVSRNNDLLTISVETNNDFRSIIFFGFGAIFGIVGPIGLLSEMNEVSVLPIILSLFIFPLFGIISLRHFLWLYRGYEIIEIQDTFISLKKRGSFWLKDRKFELEKVSDLKCIAKSFSVNSFESRVDKIRKSNQLINPFKTHGSISFYYEGSCIKFFGKLDYDEAGQVLNLIKKEITKPNNT